MPVDDLVDTAFQRSTIECASQSNSGRNIVISAVMVQFIEKPEPLLSKGERESVGVACLRAYPRPGRTVALVAELAVNQRQLFRRQSLDYPI